MINLSLPIYHTFFYPRGKKKTRIKNKKKEIYYIHEETILVGLNWFRNEFYIKQNDVKIHYHNLISESVKDKDIKIDGKYTVSYKLFYKNKSCDAMNIIPMIDKFLNDSIQELGIVKNDNVRFYTRGIWEVSALDHDNPRLEIKIEEIK
jgi:hypothetical protein